jgi:hypothetical protein
LIFQHLRASFKSSMQSIANLFKGKMATVMPSFPFLSNELTIRGVAIAATEC